MSFRRSKTRMKNFLYNFSGTLSTPSFLQKSNLTTRLKNHTKLSKRLMLSINDFQYFIIIKHQQEILSSDFRRENIRKLKEKIKYFVVQISNNKLMTISSSLGRQKLLILIRQLKNLMFPIERNKR